VVAVIIPWNTVYMQRATNALRAPGETINDDLLGFLAPWAGSTSTWPAITSGA
jgi:hypothetical protein